MQQKNTADDQATLLSQPNKGMERYFAMQGTWLN